MEIVGFALPVLIVILVGVFLPNAINRQKNSADSHSEDRFSTGIRVLDTTQVAVESTSRKSTSLVLGVNMQAERKATPKTAQQLEAIRMAKAIRNYNVARRHAAAQRRLTLLIVELAIAMVVATMGAVSMISLWWTVLPGVLMVTTLGLGAKAAHQGRLNDQLDVQRIRALESGEKPQSNSPQVDKTQASSAVGTDGAGASKKMKKAARGLKALQGFKKLQVEQGKKDQSLTSDTVTGQKAKAADAAGEIANDTAKVKATTESEEAKTKIDKKMTPAQQRFAAQKLKEREAQEVASAPATSTAAETVAISSLKTGLQLPKKPQLVVEDSVEKGTEVRTEAPKAPRRSKSQTAAMLLAKIADREAEKLNAEQSTPPLVQVVSENEESAAKGQAEDGTDSGARNSAKDESKKRDWKPMPMPVPVYNLKPMIQRRDIDAKALLEEQFSAQAKKGRVPYRPTKITVPFRESFSTQQLSQLGSPVDVDQILDNRRVANS